MEAMPVAKRLEDIRSYIQGRIDRDKERFIRYLERNTMRLGDCVIWTGDPNTDYCSISVRVGPERQVVYVHRLFWVLANGRNIQHGWDVDHKCVNTRCVSHLQECSHPDNMRLMHARAKARRTETPTRQVLSASSAGLRVPSTVVSNQRLGSGGVVTIGKFSVCQDA